MVYQHPFTDKSMVESYIPPNQHYLPHPSFLPPNYHPSQEQLQRLPSPRIPISADTTATRLQGSPFNRGTEVVRETGVDYAQTYGTQYTQEVNRRSGFDSQFGPQVVGRPLQEHELPPEVRQALAKEGHNAPQFIRPPEGQLPPLTLSGRQSNGETQLPPQFIGRTVNETYLSPRTLSQQSYAPPSGRGIGSQSVGQTGLSFFQNVVDPQGVKGGRFEETVYIQRP